MAPSSEPVSDPADLTLDELRAVLAPHIAAAAAFDGWSELAVRDAAAKIDADPDVATYAFRDGQMAMIEAWIGHVDAAMEAAFADDRLDNMPIRERIRQLVEFRLNAIAGMEESLRRALAVMAMPQNVSKSLRLGWRTADRMWRLAGDTATDYNYYTKRATLSGIYAATLGIFAGDESEGKSETKAFLDRRIEGIMRFEKAKAKILRPADERFSVARFLGRLRYPAK